jgi:hypothetical protein
LVAPTKQSFGVAGSQAELGNQGDDALVDLLARAIADDTNAADSESLADGRSARSRRARMADAVWDVARWTSRR